MKLPDAVNCTSKRNFTQVSNDLIRDETLSFKAKGLSFYLKSQFEPHKICISEIAKHSSDGKAAISGAIKELQEKGYLKIIKYKSTETGKYMGSFWIMADKPYMFNMKNCRDFANKHQLTAKGI